MSARPGLARSLATTTAAAVLLVAAPASAQPLAAAPDPLTASKGAPAAAPAPPPPACTLAPSRGKSVRDEWHSCLGVGATLDRVPAVGETAELRVTVQADAALQSTVDVELPPNLAWASVPAGFAQRTERSLRPEAAGELAHASSVSSMVKGQTREVVGRVRAVTAGEGQIRATATAPYQGGVQAGSDSVFLTVGADGASSRRGLAAAQGPGTVKQVPRLQGTRPRPAVTQQMTPDVPPDVPAAAPGAPCDTRVSGNFGYFDQNGAWQDSWNLQVEVWDDDTFGDTRLAAGVTNSNGDYNICFDAFSEGFPDSGTADVYVRFTTTNSQWQVQNGSPLAWVTGTTNDVTPGSTLGFGSLTAGNPADYRGIHAFDSANDVWVWLPKPTNLCFDQSDATCRKLRINWAPDSTDGTYYSTVSKDVHLAADDPNAQIVTAHEIGHAIMDDEYNDAYPPRQNCNPHTIEGATSVGCAWTEGFAEWLPATVYNDPFFRWPSGASLNLETPTWDFAGWSNGDATEGRIAGSLIDLTDFANEAPWDVYGEGSGNIWHTFTHHISNTLGDFWNQRAADGFNVADSGGLSSLYQNTVDYGFRNPLSDGVALARPTPLPPHNYGYGTSSGYWSVVGLRSSGADYDLDLYDDRGQSVSLAGSGFGGSVVDFVAVDSNRRALGDYYPRARVFSGSGSYAVELAAGSTSLSLGGSSSMTMGSGDVIGVRDTFLNAGQPVTISVSPGNSGQDAELFLMGVDSSTVLGRSGAVSSSSATGAGGVESLTYTPATAGWYGVVVVNKSGSGTYTLSRRGTGPTGSVTMFGGAAVATTRVGPLSISATDPESPVTSMRIARDGVLDREPWETFQTSLTTTLQGGNGVKATQLQLRNAVGQVSPVYTDTITLSLPDLSITALSAPPATVGLGKTFSATDTTRNIGTRSTAATTSRYYLSADAVRGPGDVLLTPSRPVPALAAGAASTATTVLTVPAGTTGGLYRVIACADDLTAVQEAVETNCRATTGSVRVVAPDLLVTAVSNPGTARKGQRLNVTDTTRNAGTAAAPATSTRYYLSTDATFSPGTDRLLTGAHAVPGLVVGANHTATVATTVPTTVPVGTYRLIAVADGGGAAVELDEANAKVSATPVVVSG